MIFGAILGRGTQFGEESVTAFMVPVSYSLGRFLGETRDAEILSEVGSVPA